MPIDLHTIQLAIVLIVNLVALSGAYWKLRMEIQSLTDKRELLLTKEIFNEYVSTHATETNHNEQQVLSSINKLDRRIVRIMVKLNVDDDGDAS